MSRGYGQCAAIAGRGWEVRYKLTAMKVPGRNRVVKTAMIFIAELSCLLAAASSFESLASSLESFASPMFTLLSDWAMRLNSYCKCA